MKTRQSLFSVFFICLITSSLGFATQINMYEKSIPLNSSPVEKVFVRGPEINMRSFIRQCENYPKDIYGDVYDCLTSRQYLADYVHDEKVLTLNDEELQNYILQANWQLSCNENLDPDLIVYQEKNVYLFSGVTFHPTKH